MTQPAEARPAAPEHRWLILGVIALAQLMIVLDATIMNIALPSAQRDLGFSIVDRQWVVTAYALAFGSLLLLGGKLADLLGRKVTFLAGLIGFAAASAVGGAAAELRHAGGGAGLPGGVRRPARAVGAVAAGRDVQRPERTRPGVRRVRRGRRGGRRGRAAAGRDADRVPVLALVPVREPDLRRPRRRGRALPAAPPARAGTAEAGPARRGAGLRLACSASSTASPTPPCTAGTRLRPGASWPPGWCCWPGSPAAGPRGRAAAAAAGRARPQPRRRLPDHADRRQRACSASSCSSPTTCSRPWASRPWSPGWRSCRWSRCIMAASITCQHRADAPVRAQAAGTAGHAARRGRPGPADQDRRALQLRRGRAAARC